MTVTGTLSNADAIFGLCIGVLVVTGAAAVQNGLSVAAGDDSGSTKPSVTFPAGTQPTSWLLGAVGNGDSSIIPTFSSGQTDVFNGNTYLNPTGPPGDNAWNQGNSAPGNSNTTLTITNATAFIWAMVGYEVQAAASYDSVVLADKPASFWKCDDPSGSTLVDSGPNNAPIALQGTAGTNFKVSQPGIGDGGASIWLDGTAGYGTFTAPAATQNAPYTIEFCIKPEGTSGTVFDTRTYGSSYLDVTLTAGLAGFHSDIGNASGFLTTTADVSDTLTAGQWYHVALIVGDTSWTWVINGSVAAGGSGSLSGVAQLWNSGQTVLWGQNFSNYTKGYLSKLAIYDYALTTDQVGAHYRASALLEVDGSTPAFTGSTTAVTSLTSPSFSPPANSLLVIVCGSTNGGGTSPVSTVTDSLASHLAYQNLVAISTLGDVQIWVADVPGTAPGAMTVTVNAASTAVDLDLGVIVMTGAKNAAAQVANANTGTLRLAAGSGTPEVSTTRAVAAGSQVVGVFNNWSNANAITTLPGQTATVNGHSFFFDDTTVGQGWWGQVLSQAAAGGEAVTVGVSSPTVSYYLACCAEILAAASYPVSPTVPLPRVVNNTPMRASTR